MEKYLISKNRLKILDSPRKNGLSGHLRIKNSDFLIDKCINSVLKFLDELIITYNPSTDKTEQVLEKWRNNKKVRIYKYPYELLFNNKKVDNILLTCANYYNFGLEKIKYKWYMKIDVDQFYDTEKIIKLKKEILKNDDDNKIYILNGLNIFEYNGNYGIYIGSRFNNYWLSPLNGGYDHVIFVPNSQTYYTNNKKNKYSIETMNLSKYTAVFIHDILWLHFGTFKYNNLLKKFIKNKNKDNYFLPIWKINDYDLTNSIFFKHDKFAFNDSWNLFYKIIYLGMARIMFLPLNLNDLYRLDMYKKSCKKIPESIKLIERYQDDFEKIQNGFETNNISLLDMKIKS